MLTAADVAKSIVDNIETQITNALKTHVRSKIKVNIVVCKERLRELSDRKHIRKAFITEVVNAINAQAKMFSAQADFEINAVRIFDSVSGVINVIKITSI